MNLNRIISFICISILLLTTSCSNKKEPKISFGIDACASCGMVIDRPNEAAGISLRDEFIPFCNPICMIHEVNRLINADIKVEHRYVSDFQSGTFIHPNQASFFVGDIPSVMNFGVVVFSNKESAQDISNKYAGEILDYTAFLLRFENPDKIISVHLNSKVLLPNKIITDKDDVLELTINSDESAGILSIHGYEKQTQLKINQNQPTKLKIVVDKPGAGFPIYISDTDDPVGQLVVIGSHTIEEEF